MDPSEERYAAHLKTLGIDATQLAIDRKGTLASKSIGSGESETLRLPRLAVTGEAGSVDADLVKHGDIGRGGMGVVWAGTQRALRRSVAVKELHADDSEETRAHLLREAIVTGAIEHPNVVPVHLLGRNEDGRPLLVMKRIEGTPWRDQLVPLFTKKGPAPLATIERQLHIFTQVCNAIDFAHSRGVLHRDLKPENVMLGSFGEVYVLDWGIARVTDEQLGLPAIVRDSEVVGTPGYMAPEMAAGDVNATDERTDVYLLGAVLHELVTGKRRHRADGVLATLAAAFESKSYAYPDWVPEEMAEICNRATHADPEQRFPDVRSLRMAVEAFMRHRSSRELSAAAVAALRELEGVLEGDVRKRTVDAVTIAGLVSEARFGLEQALAHWDGNREARRALQRLRVLMVGYEIDNGNLRAAKAQLAALDEPQPELEARLREAEAEARKRVEEVAGLERMRAEGDIRTHAGRRIGISWVFGGILAIVIGTLGVLHAMGLSTLGYPEALGIGVLFLGVAFDTRRRRQVGNLADRRIIDSIVITAVMAVLSLGLSWRGDVDFTVGLAITMYVTGAGTAVMAAVIDRSLTWSALGFLVTAALITVFPRLRGVIMGLGCLVSFAAAARAWRGVGARGEDVSIVGPDDPSQR